jgi:HEPN domain-containing protein
MGKNVTYFDMAENDYLFLSKTYEDGRVGNAMCYIAQNICERYLKHVIDISGAKEDITDVLRTHSLKILRKYIVKNIEEFQCDWTAVLQADGFYFSARYPGEESFIVDEDDVRECWEAVEETRNATLHYIQVCQEQQESLKSQKVLETDSVIKALNDF